MNNITGIFNQSFYPKQGILLCEQKRSDSHRSILLSFEVDAIKGIPKNFHPLAEDELQTFQAALTITKKSKRVKKRIKQTGELLPVNVLYVNKDYNTVIWHTPIQKRMLFFKKELTIQNGQAWLPALLWKVSNHSLQLFAHLEASRPTLKTPLLYAPFLNINKTGGVCMGTAGFKIDPTLSLSEHIAKWETHFFNSNFTHLNDMHQPVEGNIIQLWQGLINSDKPFPSSVLRAVNKKTLSDLLNGID